MSLHHFSPSVRILQAKCVQIHGHVFETSSCNHRWMCCHVNKTQSPHLFLHPKSHCKMPSAKSTQRFTLIIKSCTYCKNPADIVDNDQTRWKLTVSIIYIYNQYKNWLAKYFLNIVELKENVPLTYSKVKAWVSSWLYQCQLKSLSLVYTISILDDITLSVS